jgi:hypothetical protein
MGIRTYYRDLKILRPEGEKANPLGGQTVQWISIPLRGTIDRAQSLVTQVNGKSGALTYATLICEICDLRMGDRVEDTDGMQYLVKGVPSDVMNRGHHMEADLQHIDGVVIGT